MQLTPGWAALIGVLAGGVCYVAVLFKEKMGLGSILGRRSDALDVWAVHGVGGILGSILTGMFATPALGAAGLVYGGVNPRPEHRSPSVLARPRVPRLRDLLLDVRAGQCIGAGGASL